MKTALVCIAKNEDFYIDEWMDYHFKLGFDDIFIYANDWTYNTHKKNIYIIPIYGQYMQTTAYNHFIQTFNNKYNWVAFFDVDEFLVLNKHNNIKELLHDYLHCNAIGINWALFGNNKHTKVINHNYNVLSRFKKRSKQDHKDNKHIKTIVRLPSSVHQHVHQIDNTWYNLNKEIRSGPFNEPVDWTVAQINHYFSKSTEELIIKCNKSRADVNIPRNFDKFKYLLDLNDVYDDSAYRFYHSGTWWGSLYNFFNKYIKNT